MLDRIRPFSEIRDDFRDVLSWMGVSGCAIPNNSRVTQYIQDIEELENVWQVDGGRALIDQKGRPRLVNSLMEADAISAVVKEIRASQQSDPGLFGKLCDCLKGPPHRPERPPT